MPELTLQVPTAIHDAFIDATARARHDTATWLAAHPDGSSFAFRDFIVQQAGAPPTGAALEADHAAVVSAVASRTPARDVEAVWIDEHGLFSPWEPARAEYTARVGVEQAKAGLALLDRASDFTGSLTFPIKDLFLRQRPFQAHGDVPLLTGVTHVRGGSFPSGHASLAFAQAAMLQALLPDHAASLQRRAEQLGFARTYAGVHYPSDVVLGAYVGAAAAAFVTARPTAKLPPRP